MDEYDSTNHEQALAVEKHAIGLARELLKLANEALPSDEKPPNVIQDAQQAYGSFAVSNGWVIAQCLLEAMDRRDVEIATLRRDALDRRA